jgi:hypothetical protein
MKLPGIYFYVASGDFFFTCLFAIAVFKVYPKNFPPVENDDGITPADTEEKKLLEDETKIN